MSVKQVYTCDVCGTINDPKNIKHMEVKIKDVTSFPQLSETFDICDDCMKAKGFVMGRKQSDDLANKKTFEDKFMEMLTELNVVFHG